MLVTYVKRMATHNLQTISDPRRPLEFEPDKVILQRQENNKTPRFTRPYTCASATNVDRRWQAHTIRRAAGPGALSEIHKATRVQTKTQNYSGVGDRANYTRSLPAADCVAMFKPRDSVNTWTRDQQNEQLNLVSRPPLHGWRGTI